MNHAIRVHETEMGHVRVVLVDKGEHIDLTPAEADRVAFLLDRAEYDADGNVEFEFAGVGGKSMTLAMSRDGSAPMIEALAHCAARVTRIWGGRFH